MRVCENPMRCSQHTRHQFRQVGVHDVEVRRHSRVPQLEAGVGQVASREQHDPRRLEEPGLGEVRPGQISGLDGHRHAKEALDPMVQRRISSQDIGVQEVTTHDIGRAWQWHLTPASSLLDHPDTLPRTTLSGAWISITDSRRKRRRPEPQRFRAFTLVGCLPVPSRWDGATAGEECFQVKAPALPGGHAPGVMPFRIGHPQSPLHRPIHLLFAADHGFAAS